MTRNDKKMLKYVREKHMVSGIDLINEQFPTSVAYGQSLVNIMVEEGLLCKRPGETMPSCYLRLSNRGCVALFDYEERIKRAAAILCYGCRILIVIFIIILSIVLSNPLVMFVQVKDIVNTLGNFVSITSALKDVKNKWKL